MRFKIIYLLFIVICIVYPHAVVAGPVTFRHLISLLMLGCCIYEGFKSDKYLYLYYAFVFFFGISSIATGFGGLFFRGLFGTYLSMIAAYAATYLLVKKYSGTNFLVWTFVSLGALNAVVTIGQFFDLSFVDDLCSFLRIEIDEKFIDKIDYYESEGLALPGLLGSVDNGYFLSATALLTLYNKKCNFYINFLLWLIVLGASFVAQERAGFMLAIAFSAYIVGEHYFSKSKSAGFFALVIILIVCGSIIYSYMDEILSSELRYTKGLDTDSRNEHRSVTWDYIINNPMGGFLEFDSGNHEHHPHNYFLNAFLYGGFFGGICVIVLLFMQIKKIIPYLLHNRESEISQWAFIWGLMYIDYSINSMVHNASIVKGVMTFFIWWGAFLASAELGEEEQAFGLLDNYTDEE